ncbi:MAG: hypothetical protein LBH69_01880 [Methanomassiliicoccaceae archaeon]|nr:hypothetical protein [Methanomassiliicoccaceae archaeon]
MRVSHLSDEGMDLGNKAGDSAGILSFLGGNRKVSTGAEEKKESLFANLGSALRITILLSMLLWWIPLIGQALAGYVGGRRAGTPARGMVVTLFSVMLLMGVATVISSGLIGGFDFLNMEPHELVAAIGMDFPLLGTLFSWMLLFLQNALGIVTGTTSMKLNIYIITVVFGFAGGTLADLHTREAKKAAPTEGGRIFIPRSLAAYVKGKKLGFENFDDRLSIQQSKVPEQQKIVTVHRSSLVRGVTAREEPKAIAAGADVPAAVQEAEGRESPFAGLIHRAEKNDPEKERIRHHDPADDMEYV